MSLKDFGISFKEQSHKASSTNIDLSTSNDDSIIIDLDSIDELDIENIIVTGTKIED